MKKNLISILFCIFMITGLLVGCSKQGGTTAKQEKTVTEETKKEETNAEDAETSEAEIAASDISIGACISKYDDTFLTGIRNHITEQASELGAQLDIVDSQSKQPTQNEQVDTYITKGVDVLAINPVDRTAAEPLIVKASAKGLPIIFFNRQPEDDVMNSYDKTYYIGAKAEASGAMSGELIVDYFRENKEADKNGDGKIQYVLLQGEPGHQDAVLRSEHAVKTINDSEFEAVELAADTAMWNKVNATDLMQAFISSIGIENIEAVMANNDDMALGAIEALKALGYNSGDATKYIPVVGVDATSPALEAMSDGSMLGTVLNDAEGQGKATVNAAVAAAQGKEITEATIGYEVTDGKYIWIPYVKVTQDNYKSFQ